MQWFTYKSRIKCCFSLNYCHFSVCFLFTVMLSRCNMAAVWFPYRSPQILSAKFPCFGFGSTNHIARKHIDKTVYGPDWLKIGTVVKQNEKQLKEMSPKVWNYCRSDGINHDYVILDCPLSVLELNKLNGYFAISEVEIASGPSGTLVSFLKMLVSLYDSFGIHAKGTRVDIITYLAESCQNH